MIPSEAKSLDNHVLQERSYEITSICPQCGGNGYTKSNPNCYHTCLDCLGRGTMDLD